MSHPLAFAVSKPLVLEANEAVRSRKGQAPLLRSPEAARASSAVPAITSVVAGAVAAAHCSHPKARLVPQFLSRLPRLAKGGTAGDRGETAPSSPGTTHILEASRTPSGREDGLDSRLDRAWHWLQDKSALGLKVARKRWKQVREHGRVGLKKVQEASKRADLPGRLQKARAVALEKFKRVKQPNRKLASAALALLLLCTLLRPGRPPVQPSTPQVTPAPTLQLLPDEEARLQMLADASPSIVYVTGKPAPWMPTEGPEGEPPGPGGSAWMFDGSHVVTSLSNIDLAQRGSLRVILADRSEMPARVVGTDPGSDLAVLEILWPKRSADARTPRPQGLPLGASASLQLGQDVSVVGRRAALDMSVSRGVVYGLGQPLVLNSDRPVQSSIQTDAVVQPSNRGGPLLNSRGQVVGMAVGPMEGSRISQAIPADSLRKYVQSILDNGHVSRPALGIYLEPDGFAERLGAHGVVVEEVLPGAARKAGLKAGDIIIFQGDVPIRRMDDLVTALEMYHPGDGFPLRVLRQTAGEGLGAPFSSGAYSTVDLRVVLGSSDYASR